MPDTIDLFQYLTFGGIFVFMAGELIVLIAWPRFRGAWPIAVLSLPLADFAFIASHWSSTQKGAALLRTGALVRILGVALSFGSIQLMMNSDTHPYEYFSAMSFGENEVELIETALTDFYAIKSRYPTTEEGLAILLQNDGGKIYLFTGSIPLDPWDYPYQYKSDGDHAYALFTFGRDRLPGGDGGEADYIVIEHTQTVDHLEAQEKTASL